ncbi:MAG: thioredoxin domain-containing protein [Candidatus Omnitrophota bacterium]
MNGDNKYLKMFFMVVLGVFGVMCLIICVSMSVRAALSPLGSTLREMLTLQRTLDAKITDGVVAQNAALNERVTALENEIRSLRQNNAPGSQGLLPALRALGNKQQQVPEPEDMNKVYDLPIDDSYVLGKPDARVTFVEFSDFQCPFCTRFHPVLMDVFKAFPDDVKLVMKNFPLAFHPNARPAAKAALAAGLQGKYYEMVELIMQNVKSLSDDKYKELAGKLGLDLDRFTRDLKEQDAAFEKKINADMQLAQKSDVRGTPTYFINGKKSSSRDLESWKAEVQALLKK